MKLLGMVEDQLQTLEDPGKEMDELMNVVRRVEHARITLAYLEGVK